MEITITEVVTKTVDLSASTPVWAMSDLNVGDTLVYTQGRGNDGREGLKLGVIESFNEHDRSGCLTAVLDSKARIDFARCRAVYVAPPGVVDDTSAE